jgi:hypothetical protein
MMTMMPRQQLQVVVPVVVVVRAVWFPVVLAQTSDS